MDIIKDTKNFSYYFYNNTINATTNLLSTITNLPLFKDFLDFMISSNILQIGFGFIIATNANKLASDFVENIISPIINFLLGGNNEKILKDYIINIFGINFQIGNFILSLIKFIIIFFLLYYTFKLLGIIDIISKKK